MAGARRMGAPGFRTRCAELLRAAPTGYAHTIEVWSDDELAGGLYGVRLAARFLVKACFIA